jgi:hypothetical protein
MMQFDVEQIVCAAALSFYPVNLVLSDGREFHKSELCDNPSRHPGFDFAVCGEEDQLTGVNFDQVITIVVISPFDDAELSGDRLEELCNRSIYD